MRRIVGKVTEEQKKEIESLFNMKRGLEELIASLVSSKTPLQNSDLYDRILKDYVATSAKFHAWWDAQSTDWESIDGRQWMIDFNTNEVYFA